MWREFPGIKEAIYKSTVLTLPDETGNFMIYSDKGLECLIMQHGGQNLDNDSEHMEKW